MMLTNGSRRDDDENLLINDDRMKKMFYENLSGKNVSDNYRDGIIRCQSQRI